MADSYQAALEWAREAKRISVPDEYQKIVSISGRFLSKITTEIEDSSERFLERLNQAIAKGQAEGGTIVVDLTLTFDLHGLEEFDKELDRLRVLVDSEEQG